jgi:hypothetical protein
MQVHEQEPFLNQEQDNSAQNSQNLTEEQQKKLKKIKKSCIIVILSAILRIAFVSIFFDPINFAFSLLISIIGFVGAAKKHKGALVTYGIVSIFQVCGVTAALIYFCVIGALYIHTWLLVGFSSLLVLLLIGGVYALKMRTRIMAYEQEHGALPRCCGRRCAFETNNQNVSPQQFAPIQETNQPNTEFVMIPMQTFDQNQQQQPIFIAQQPQQQPIFFNQQTFDQNQQQPIFIAQQPQPQQQQQQQQQQNSVPLVYAFPQGTRPNTQVFGQNQPFVQFIPQQQNVVPQQPQQQSTNYVYRN